MIIEYVSNLAEFKRVLIEAAAFIKNNQGKMFRFRFDLFSPKAREQEEKYHAMLGDIADQAMHLNRHFDTNGWQRLCIDKFAKDCIENDIDRCADYFKKQNIELVPSLDGKSVVVLGSQSRDFPQYVASAFIEWLFHYGAENRIVWSDPKYQDEYERIAA